ncbi:hypothetical protein Tco_0245893, partial [Tanacetum coccineum]
NQTHLGISKEVGTPRCLSPVVPQKKVGDEAVHKELGDRMERAVTTASSLEVEQDNGSGPRCQDTILGDVNAQTRFEIASKQSNDPPLSRGYTLGSGEDNMKLLELMEFFNAAKHTVSTTGILSAAKIMLASVNAIRHILMLLVQVPTTKGVSINTSIKVSEEVGEDSDHPTDSTQIPILDQPSTSSKPKKNQTSKKTQRQEAEVPQDETEHEESVLDLEKAKDAQAKEIAALKKRIQKLERKKMSRPTGLKRLKKVGMSRRVESSEDQESLVAPEDASKQGRSIADIDADVEVTLVDETQERQDDELMFDTGVLDTDEMHVEAKVDEKDEQSTKPDDSTASEAVTTASVKDSAAPTTIEEITLAQTLIQIKAAKPKVVTTAATTTTTTSPKARGVVVQELSEFRVPQEAQPSISKDKGKGIMVEPEVPLKRKDQIALDEQIARDIQAKLDAELIEEQKLARKQEEEANIALIESWENTQAMIEADRLLAERLQSKEREKLTDEEKGKLFMKLMEKIRKHFAALRAQEKRNIPPTKAQKRTQMSTYLKHMDGYTYKQLKGKSFDEIQKLFDKEMKRVNTFVAMGSESDEVEEVNEDDEAELKKLLVIKKDEDITINAIRLATKLPVIIDYKLLKEGVMIHYQLIRADGSSKRYSSMIRMLQGIDREDLEALWRIVKAKYSDTRPENEFKRVLWGDLKVMFEPDIRSDVWRM